MTKRDRNRLLMGVIGIALVAWGVYSFVTRPVYEAEAGERPFKGRADASIVITEFSDFECPACKATVPLVQYLDEQYGANIRINYKHLPLRAIHQNAYDAALASECANDQGLFWEMHDLIFGYQPNIGKAQLKKIAADIEGMDTTAFNACLDAGARKDVVNADLAEAAGLGLNGTPSFLYNGQIVQNRAELEPMIRRDLGLPPLE